MSRQSFTRLVESGRSNLVYLVRGTANGRRTWTYLLVHPLKLIPFKAKLGDGTGTIDLADYGRVLESGWGEDPPASIQEKIASEYH